MFTFDVEEIAPKEQALAANPANSANPEPQISNISSISNQPRPIPDETDDVAAEARRQHVLALLAGNPTARYALVTDTEAEADCVILTLAVRDRATCDIRIPREKYDPFLLLDLIDRYSSTAQ